MIELPIKYYIIVDSVTGEIETSGAVAQYSDLVIPSDKLFVALNSSLIQVPPKYYDVQAQQIKDKIPVTYTNPEPGVINLSNPFSLPAKIDDYPVQLGAYQRIGFTEPGTYVIKMDESAQKLATILTVEITTPCNLGIDNALVRDKQACLKRLKAKLQEDINNKARYIQSLFLTPGMSMVYDAKSVEADKWAANNNIDLSEIPHIQQESEATGQTIAEVATSIITIRTLCNQASPPLEGARRKLLVQVAQATRVEQIEDLDIHSPFAPFITLAEEYFGE